MKNIAILVGVSAYTSQSTLACCAEDVAAVQALLEATGRYETIDVLLDPDADMLKARLRNLRTDTTPIGELLFYFSGHGYFTEDEFYFCTSDFLTRNPNTTGLSTSELHDRFREAEPDFVVKIIDACHSGSPLIKSAMPGAFNKGSFNKFLQIASCLTSQVSLTGEPLSRFTESLCRAAIQKTEGPIYYTDVTSALRDAYIADDDQTPFFVTQAPGRELFVEDGASLASFRELFAAKWSVPAPPEPAIPSTAAETSPPAPPLSLTELLERTEAGMATPESVKTVIDHVFNGLMAAIRGLSPDELFTLTVDEDKNYYGDGIRAFMTRTLTKEERRDEFVTARPKRKESRNRYESLMLPALGTTFFTDKDWVDNYDLDLNLPLERAQLRIVLTPLFRSLQQFHLTISCAPSLDKAYFFVLGSRHLPTAWNRFAEEGAEVVRRSFKTRWNQDPEWVVDDIIERIDTAIKEHVGAISADLSPPTN